MATKKKSTTRPRSSLSIDPIHDKLDIYSDPLVHEIWHRKYRDGNESTALQTIRRAVEGVYAKDPDEHAKWQALEAMEKLLFIPGGRILAGAGTPYAVTLINCYVSRTIQDSMPDIMDALKEAALTQQQGGGIGMDFSTLRPAGAYLRRTGAVASGPLHFMDMWDSMCQTIKSAGGRRGAMMATLHCEHPDLLDFITAKQEKGRLTNFNVSVLVTDAFMSAVENDEDWYLGFHEPRADGQHLYVTERDDDNALKPGTWYAYSCHKARDLWDMILKNTYEYSEPGVIFIDRINEENNLKYIEHIMCTNPCGEQPLPPYACCNLGAVNLARMVKDPFTTKAKFDFVLLSKVTSIAMRFLDNVIDVTNYPLPEQAAEEFNKRRTGLGITGLADCMAMLGIKYNSDEAVTFTETVMGTLKCSAYAASVSLAKERGPFPLYDAEQWGDTTVVRSLPAGIKEDIAQHGIRNSVILTIAPTGTTSIFAGNVSSGLEPVFKLEIKRNVRQEDESTKLFTSYDYAAKVWKELHGDKEYPNYMVEHDALTPRDHLRIQEVCQVHVDASISKTINCPKDMSFEDFEQVYLEAYARGCKGCTTYRPSDIRGSVLVSEEEQKEEIKKLEAIGRPDVLQGNTYKRSWPAENASYYITVNDTPEGRPYEMFIHSSSSKHTDWTTALSLMISALMRRGEDVSFIPKELAKVASAHNSGFVGQRYFSSLAALIGDTLQQHLDGEHSHQPETAPKRAETNGERCPECHQFTMFPSEGCLKCNNCGYAHCG